MYGAVRSDSPSGLTAAEQAALDHRRAQAGPTAGAEGAEAPPSSSGSGSDSCSDSYSDTGTDSDTEESYVHPSINKPMHPALRMSLSNHDLTERTPLMIAALSPGATIDGKLVRSSVPFPSEPEAPLYLSRRDSRASLASSGYASPAPSVHSRQSISCTPASMITITKNTAAPDPAVEELSYTQAVVELLRQAAPTCAAQLVYNFNPTITTGFVAQLGSDSLASYSVAVSIFNVCALSLCQGLVTGLDTLAPQLYGGGGSGVAMGTLLHRAFLLGLGTAGILGILLALAGPLLSPYFFGSVIGPDIGLFLALSFPNLMLQVTSNILRRILRAERIQDIPLYGSVASVAVCPIVNAYLTTSLPMTVAVLTLCSFAELAVMTGAALMDGRVSFARRNQYDAFTGERAYRGLGNCWFLCGPWEDVVDGPSVRTFMAVSLPSLGSTVAAWWGYEAFVFLAAQVSATAVAAYALNVRVMMTLFAAPNGLGTACSILVGNALGANAPDRARHMAHLCQMLSFAFVGATGVLLWFTSDWINSQYTKDHKLLDALGGVKWGLVAMMVGCGIQCVLQGTYRGAGEQQAALHIVLFSMWLVAVPLGIAFTYLEHWGLVGVYAALVTGLWIQVPLMAWRMAGWDWEFLAARAVERTKRDTDKVKAAAAAVAAMFAELEEEERHPLL